MENELKQVFIIVLHLSCHRIQTAEYEYIDIRHGILCTLKCPFLLQDCSQTNTKVFLAFEQLGYLEILG
jgi:hypothetical protein